MIVHLTSRQYDAVCSVLPEAILDFVDHDPAVGPVDWREIPDFFLWVVENHLSTLDHGARASVALAHGIQRIVRETNAYRSHPAFWGVGVVGEQSTLLTGWRTPAEHLEPFLRDAMPDAEFKILTPFYPLVGGQRVTMWSPMHDPQLLEGDPYLNEARHREFWALTHQDAPLQ